MKNTHDRLDALHANESDLRKFLLRSVGCLHTAADIFQKIAENLLTRTDSAPIANQRAYLYQAARNEVVSHYRSEEKRLSDEGDRADVSEELDYRDAERIAIADESLRVLNSSLDELPYLSRQIFILYRIDGVKQASIARQLGLNLSTVEKRLALATRHCRMRLGESEACQEELALWQKKDR